MEAPQQAEADSSTGSSAGQPESAAAKPEAASQPEEGKPAAAQPSEGEAEAGEPGAESSGAEAAPAPAGDSSLDLEKLARIWPAVLDHLRQTAPALAATFEGARPVAFDGKARILQIGFPAESTFNKRKAEAKDKRELVAKALEAVVGEPLSPTYVLLDGKNAEGSSGGTDQVDEEELVERLKSEFNAEEVS